MPPLALLPNQPTGSPDILSTGYGAGLSPTTTVYGGGYTPQDAATVSAAIERQREIADRDYDLRKKQAKREYETALMSARTAQDVQAANERYQDAQAEIARDRLAFDRDVQAQNLAWEREKFGQQFGLQQAELGYNLLGQAAQLRGPANYYQASEYARGISSMPQTSTFLSALQNNNRLSDFGAQGGLPERETLGTLSAKLGGGTGLQNGAPSEDATLGQIGNIAAKGAHQLGAGALEQLTPTELGLFTSGLDRLGIDKDTFLSQYRRSRVGQSYANAAAA